MSEHRYINTKFWDDAYIIKLDPIEKLLFLYFITNPITNLCGIYEISLKRISFDTGIDGDMVLRILKRFEKENKMIYRNDWIYIINFIKNQNTKSKDIMTGISRIMEAIPIEIHTKLKTGWGEGVGRVGGVSDILNLTKLNLTKRKNDDETTSFKEKKETTDLKEIKDWVDIDFQSEWNKSHRTENGLWVVRDKKGKKLFYKNKKFYEYEKQI